jgi:hypothetical protein
MLLLAWPFLNVLADGARVRAILVAGLLRVLHRHCGPWRINATARAAAAIAVAAIVV